MRVIRTVAQMQAYSRTAARRGERLGLVPTMGALHQGHMNLVRRACAQNDRVVVSIFVNPLQFGPREDFGRYPRSFVRDRALLSRENVDILFHPSVSQMYPSDFLTSVSVDELSEHLCGRSRPGHFRGVATVVAKLFNAVGPARAYFGQKDAQQVRIIQQMVADLAVPVKIEVLPIARERDGLALSSRNAYLSAAERADAPVLFQALEEARQLIRAGVRSSARIARRMRTLIDARPCARIDYISLVDPRTLRPVARIVRPVLIALAVFFGRTRLIDNCVVTP